MENEDRAQIRIEEELRIEGVLSKGFGIAPKIVATDRALTIEAKAIYGYLASYCGGGNTAYPGRDKILRDLQISKNAYYNHFRMLVSSGYLSACQFCIKGVFSHNIYTIVASPDRLHSQLISKDLTDSEKEAFSLVARKGLLSAGYGTIPKLVMTDRRISIKAKGLYFYLASLSGPSLCAFPSKDLLKWHLQIGHEGSLKYMGELKACDYIEIERERIAGKLGKNIYHLVTNPGNRPESANSDTDEMAGNKDFSPESANEDTGKPQSVKCDTGTEDTEKRDAAVQDTEESDTAVQDTGNCDTNINIENSNRSNNITLKTNRKNIISNNMIHQSIPSEASPLEDRWAEVIDYYRKNKEFPFWLIREDVPFTEYAVEMMSSKFLFLDQLGEFEKEIYHTLKQVIFEMLTTPKLMNIGDSVISGLSVWKRIGKVITYYEEWPNLSLVPVILTSIERFKKAAKEYSIKNKKGYLRTVFCNILFTDELSVLADIAHDFPEEGKEEKEEADDPYMLSFLNLDLQ